MIDLTGYRRGRLTVVKFSHFGKRNKRYWLCQCDCGNQKTIVEGSLKNTTKSCGCLQKEVARIYNFNQNYFDEINSEQKAYILGFIAADGNNNKEGVRIEINKRDKHLLHDIQKEIGECNITCRNDTNLCGIYYYSTYMSGILTNWGIVPAKTHVLSYPKRLNDTLNRHFIRGYFDGDGGIYIDKKQYNRVSVSFTGNNLIIKEIQKIIYTHLGIKGYTHCRHPTVPNIINLSYCGTISCIKLLKWLYEGSSIHLNRKYKSYLKIIEFKNKRDLIIKLKTIERTLNCLKKNAEKREESEVILNLLKIGYSKRQIKIQYGIDIRKTAKIIKEYGFQYPRRRRMFAVDVNK